MTRSEYDANLALQRKETPSWQKPAPVRKAKTATLPQWLLNYLWKK